MRGSGALVLLDHEPLALAEDEIPADSLETGGIITEIGVAHAPHTRDARFQVEEARRAR